MTDAVTIGQILPYIIPAVGAVVFIYTVILKREKALWGEIAELRRMIEAMKTNYLDRFATVNGNIHESRTVMMTALNDLERNLRESHHTLSDNVAKSLSKMELYIIKKGGDDVD